jgi:16S rRNA (cytosine1402-N4)-methyltransferase
MEKILPAKPLSRLRRDARFSSFANAQGKSAHTPVLLNEVIRFLAPQPGEFFIDGTVNGGGHAQAILEKVGPKGKLLGVDWDPEALARCRQKLGERSNVMLVQGNFADISGILERGKLGRANGLLLDLGFSSHQTDVSGRGFSFMKDEPLQMTYDPQRLPASSALAQLSEKELAEVLAMFGQERYARRIARAIKEAKRRSSIRTSGELVRVVAGAVPKGYERGRIHPATRTFQALRMFVNDELSNIALALEAIPKILTQGGRVAVISFHSLEDGTVKRIFRELASRGALRIVTKKPVRPAEKEISENPRSRSARLRAATVTEL